MLSCDFLIIYQWVRRTAVAGGGGGGWGWAGYCYCLRFVFIWSGKSYFYQGKVREFCTLMSVATMNFSEAVSIRLHKLLVLVRDFVCFI